MEVVNLIENKSNGLYVPQFHQTYDVKSVSFQMLNEQ